MAAFPRVTILTAPAAETRVGAAGDFLRRGLANGEAVLVGETREAADDLARDIAAEAGATFGLHRFSLRQLAWRIAAVDLARRGLVPATALAVEAVATHAAFEELWRKTLGYLHPIARFRSFGRTLAATLRDLRHADVDVGKARQLGGSGPDVARLADRYSRLLDDARLVDGAALYRTAARIAGSGSDDLPGAPLGGALVLLDVAVTDEAAFDVVSALAGRAAATLATVPAGDDRTRAALRRLPGASETVAPAAGPAADPLDRVRHFLFAPGDPPPPPAAGAADSPALTFFSAPGEGREAVEIARAIVAETARGVPFDRMAVLLRSPGVYAGPLETALGRAGIPAWFAKGVRMPHPAGRAFLALLACAAEHLSARRFSEYLSLGQVPRLGAAGAPPGDRGRWVPPDSAAEVVPAPAQLSFLDVLAESGAAGAPRDAAPADSDDEPVLAGTLRTPSRWERLLVESAVVGGGGDRWERRLDGLGHELELKLAELRTEEPDSPRVTGLERDLANLDHLRRFALPIVDQLAAFPAQALWGEWLDHLDALAPMVLANPDRVLAVLGDLRPMAPVGPVPLAGVRDVLHDRLTELPAEPPPRRFGRVFVGGPEQVRGRRFAVVFVPGLAERVFPQKQRQDPLLLDDLRAALNASPDEIARLGLPDRHALNAQEKLLLRLAVGAAAERVHFSYPRLDVSTARPRVPSFYALDVERARTGRIPDFREVEQRAFREVDARLAWPAPSEPARAIDAAEHDLAVLGPLLRPRPAGEVAGRARYLFRLNPGLRRSLVARWARWKRPWSRYDGLCGIGGDTKELLAAHRLAARPYSPSSLQHFAVCPYKFLLAAVHRLRPREEVEPPIERMDPLTRGRMFHQVQAELVRTLGGRDGLPVTRARVRDAETVVDAVLDRVAADYEEQLAPAIAGVWKDEIESMRADLKGWLHHVANEEGEWIPVHAEFGFGLPPGGDRDPDSVPDPVTLDGRWRLRGVVDLIEAKARPTARGELRVTDHKTGRNRTREGMVVDGGAALQPVLYGLAVEQALGRPVSESRLFFSTAAGRYERRVVELGDRERRHGVEVLEIIDRAVEAGALLPAPRQGACRWCDFRTVCGPWEEQRSAVKDQAPLADLAALRRLP